ncbi:polyhydroxyalkanoate depolymerase [Sphingorhabdus arenilitoris]|uniref:Polyhydroxyalkanoate depolymerase n=1 Tax=Sphingorhabdus arenilitoris TaxID=1490041 RepID=A0ABV8RIC1_9SPHN
MLYTAYEMQKNILAGAGKIAGWQAQILNSPLNPVSYLGGSVAASALDVFAHSVEIRGKPEFGLNSVTIDGTEYPVEEMVEARKPFGQLKHFVHAKNRNAPRLLIIAPMSGHFATLLRGTVERMMPDHDVWITDWRDARDVPLTGGGFDLETYIDYIIEWLEFLGPDKDGRGAHLLAVCQPSVPAYAAAAIMGQKNHPLAPRTLTMMGGPIDTREAPTAVNDHATDKPHEWFIQNVIATVPRYYRGAGRRVYPGFLQLYSFMSMNLGSHMTSHWQMFNHLVDGDGDGADKHKEFYDEYRSVCDMTAEFYLQTIDVVFQRHLLPKGEFNYRGMLVDPAAITRTAIMAVEGERDDISGIGQTKAALSLASKLPDENKHYYLVPEVGHYGIFNGSKWRTKIAPVLEDWIRKHDGSAS